MNWVVRSEHGGGVVMLKGKEWEVVIPLPIFS